MESIYIKPRSDEELEERLSTIRQLLQRPERYLSTNDLVDILIAEDMNLLDSFVKHILQNTNQSKVNFSEACDNDNNNALMLASKHEKFNLVQNLIKLGAKVNQTNCHKMTALCFAAQSGNEEIINFLLQAQEDVNGSDLNTEPIIFAAENNHLAAVKLLTKNGASVISLGARHNNTLIHAAKNDNFEMVKWLLKKYNKIGFVNCESDEIVINNVHGKFTPLSAAVSTNSKNSINIIKLLLKNKADIIGIHKSKTPLMCAAESGNVEAIPLLIKFNKEHNKNTSQEMNIDLMKECQWSKESMTPLMYAAAKNHVNVIIRLAKAGANPNTKQLKHDKLTATMIAAQKNSQTALAKLLELDADINITDINGMNTLMHGAKNGNVEVVDMLIKKRNADVRAINQASKKTVLDYAIESKNIPTIIRVLHEERKSYKAKDLSSNTYYIGHIQTLLSLTTQDKYDAIGEIFLSYIEVFGCTDCCRKNLCELLIKIEEPLGVQKTKEYIKSHKPSNSEEAAFTDLLNDVFSNSTIILVDQARTSLAQKPLHNR